MHSQCTININIIINIYICIYVQITSIHTYIYTYKYTYICLYCKCYIVNNSMTQVLLIGNSLLNKTSSIPIGILFTILLLP